MTEQLKIIISAEVEKLKQNVEEAKTKIKSFKEQVKEAAQNVDEDFSKAGESIKKGMKAAAVGIAAAGTALLALGASTKEYRNEQAKLVTAFEAAGASAEQAKGTYNDLFRVLGDSGQATEAASHLAKLTTNQKDLSEWTNICQGVYATFGDSLPIESLTEAANETAKTGALTGALADALNWAGVSEDAFQASLDACNTEAEREALIRSTLNGLYTEAAAKYETNNADVIAQNEAQAKLDETLGKLGATVAPLIVMLTDLASNVLSALMPYVQDFTNKYLPEIKKIIEPIVKTLGDAIGFLLEHKGLLIAIAAIIGTVTTAIGIYNTVQAVKTAMDAANVTTVWALVAAHIAQAAAAMAAMAPYILIVAAIAAVIAIIVLCIKHWDDIVAAVKNAMAKMKEWISAGIEVIRNIFSKVTDFITKPIEKARDAVKNIIEKIKSFFKFKLELPKFKMPSITVQWKDSPKWMAEAAKFIGLQGVPSFGVKWNALGGVFDKPTIFSYGGSLQGIGEDGAEAVVPLENNLGWLEKLADMLSSRMGGGAPIVLQVDGKTFAQISVDSINQLTKQTGELPLVLV